MRTCRTRLASCGAAIALASACFAQCGVNFAPMQPYSVPGMQQHIAIGDLNGDSWPDLVTCSQFGGSATVLLATGGGTYGPPVSYPGGVGSLRCAAIVDVNHDSRLDIVAVGGTGGSNVAVLRGNGDGTFQSPIFASAGSQPNFVVAADLNADGHIDLAAANLGGNDVSVLRGNGDGTFQPAQSVPAGGGPRWLAVAHLNGDAIFDLLVVNQNSNDISALLGAGGGNFQAPINTPLASSPRSVAAGDLDGDGLDDAVVGSSSGGSVHVLLSAGGGSFQPPTTYSVGGGACSVAVGDLDLDGRPDAISANNGSSNVSILLGVGDGTLTHVGNLPVSNAPNAAAIGNLDASGGLDIATAGGGGLVSVLLNQAVPLGISQQPTSCQVVQTGQPVSLTVAASGPGTLAYQWRKNGVNIADGGAVSGATSATLTISPSACGDSASYDVIVSSPCGGAPVTSTAAIVAVTGADVCAGLAPSIIQHPAGQSVLSGAIAVFTVSLAPSNLGATYQWRRGGANLSNGGSISGATSAVLVIAPSALSDNGTAYDCVVTNSCGSVRSNPAGLAVARRCSADANNDGSITSADVGTFVNDWFAQLSAGCQ